MWRRAAAAIALAAALTGCTAPARPAADPTGSSGGPAAEGAAPGAEPPRLQLLDPLDPSSSLTPAGQRLAASVDWTTRPAYEVEARIQPVTGAVDGTWTAVLPVGTQTNTARLRWFPGLSSLDTDAELTDVQVDGEPVQADVEESLAVVPLPPGHGSLVRLDARFSYTVRELAPDGGALTGLFDDGGLQPADVGLLARHRDALSLGHWFPLWIPAGGSAAPVPDGFGDLGNFPAASIRVRVDVPAGWQVVGGGVPASEAARLAPAGRRGVVEEGLGLRDLSLALLRDVVVRERMVGGTTVRAVGPATDARAVDAVLAEAVESFRTLSAAFGPYPWRQLDVVATPLGSGVGGMEWPGAVWIESTLFGGGIPGLPGGGDLTELGDLGELGGLLGSGKSGRDELGRLFGDGPLAAALHPASLQALRRWTVAHEVGHEWWHALVGNDSVLAPVIDEPLAQYAACLAVRSARATRPQARTICEGQIAGTYAQMRLLGEADAAAARPADAFDSALQYGGLVYGKAPALYLALEERFGAGRVQRALRGVAEDRAFQLLQPGELRADLGRRLGDRAAVDRLWRRWLTGRTGDADLGVDPQAGLESLFQGLLGGLETPRPGKR